MTMTSDPAAPSASVNARPRAKVNAQRFEVARPRIDDSDPSRHGVRIDRRAFDLELVVAGRRTSGNDEASAALVTPGKRAHARLQGVEEELPLLRLRILALDELRPQRQQMARLEAEIERVELEEAARHQPGAGEQRQRQRQLDDDER